MSDLCMVLVTVASGFGLLLEYSTQRIDKTT